jgi:penicillin-binding protein 1C
MAPELALKVRNGRPPFSWIVDGRPLDARRRLGREARWRPDGPGYVTIAVIDAAGRAARARVRLR